MNDILSENTNFPVIEGKIVAFFQLNRTVIRSIFKKYGFKDFHLEPRYEILLKKSSPSEEWKAFEKLKNTSPQEVYQTNWKLVFNCEGPDRRYNQGTAELNSEKVEELFDIFCDASKKMSELSKTEFSGTYKKQLGKLQNPMIEVFADNNKILMCFWVSSNSQRLARTLHLNEVEQIAEQLTEIPERARKLMTSLKKISL